MEELCLALKPARRSELLDQLRRLRASDDVARAHPVDIAEALNLLDPRVAGRALSSLPFDLAVRVLEQPEFDRRATPPISKPRIAPRRCLSRSGRHVSGAHLTHASLAQVGRAFERLIQGAHL